MRKILSLMMMMFASIALVFADEPVQIASGTFDGKNATYTEGWTTTGTGVGRTDCIIIGAEENITSPEVDLSLYESISIAIKARRYGSLSGSKAEIAVTFDGEAIGNATASGTSATTALDVINYTVNDLSTGNFVITCTNATSAGSSHGAGINSIVITGVLKSQGGDDPQPAHTYTVAGDNTTLFGTAWTPSLEANDMALVEGLYTWEKTEQTLAAGTIEFKVCEDHAWTTSYPAQNYQLNIAEAGVYTIKITYNPEGNAVNAVATKTGDAGGEDPQPTHTYTVAGDNTTLFGTAWTPSLEANDMVLVEGLYTWEKTEQTLAAGTIEFKVCQDHAWTTSYPEQNYQLLIAEAGVYTIKITYNPEGNVVNAVATKTGDVDPEEPGEIVLPVVKLAGSLTSWSEPVLMVNAEDSLSASVTLNLGIDHYQLKVVSDGNWLSKAGDGDLYTMNRDWNHVDHLDLINTGDNIKLITDAEGEYTFTWTYADSSLVVTFPEAPAQPKFYITGNEDIVGEGNPTWGKNGALESFSDTLVMNLAAGFHKFKLITPAEQWLGMEALTDTAYGLFTDDDTNICFNLADAGEVTVIYNATEFKVEGDFYIAPVANYYLIGDSAFVVDAGATADKAWTPDAIPSFQDTTVLNLKAGVNYIMRLSLEGTWENHRDFRHLTDTAAGLIELPDEFENHSIGFSLAEAGEVTIIYIPAANEQPEVFKLIGNFYVAPAPDPTVSVFGSMTDPAWNVEVPFVLSDDKTYASLTVEHIGAGEYEFKFFINGDYRSNGYRFHREFTGAAGITENNDANMVFVADQDGEYTFYWFFANDSAAIVYPEYIEPAKEYYAKYADAWTWVKMTEAEGLWLTDTIVYKGIGININDKAADENNMFYSNTVEEEGVRPIAGPTIDVNDTIYFTFNPADSVVTAVMVGKYVAPPTPDPTVGVRGSMNDWAEEPIPFVLSADKTYASLTVEHISAGEYEFKFLINGDYRSNGYRFHREFTGAAGITTDNDANMIFEADVDGEYTFYWYFANDSLGIVYPEYIEPAKEYYAKYADAWTWVKLTEAEGLWLTDTIVYKGIGININDKAADENNMFYSNTVEEEGVRPIAGPAIDVNDTIYFTFNPADSVVTAVMVGKYVAPVEETKDIVIVPGAWEGLHLGAWAWVDGEAGAWYPVVLDNEQLIATIPAAADRIIVATFAEGAELNWDNKINQTSNQVIDACGVLYINDNNPTWCEQGGFVEELYTIAGSGSILGVDWDQTAAINDMVFNAETGIYTLVKENLTLTAFEYQYKVAKDHVWNAGQYPASGNQVLAITEDGIYNVTFTFNPAIPLLTAEAEKIQDIVVEKHYLVVGQDMIANGEDWNNDTDINLMTTADEGLTYTLTVNGAELVADASYRYKIVEKGTWNEYFPNIGGADASFTVEEDGIYTITYTYTVATSQCDVQTTKTAELPEARLTDGYYIVGTFSAVDAWTVDDLTEAQRFVEYNTDEFGTYYSLTVDLAEGDQFKVVQIIHDAIVRWMPEGDGNNTVIDANHAGVAKNIYLNIMVNNTWDYSVEPNLYNGYYLLGTMNDWTPSADYMLGVDETCAEGELMLVTTFAQNDALKVAYVYNGVATQWYPGEGIDDYVIDANHAGETSIYFRYDGQGSADWYYGFFYVIPLSHTDIDNVNAAGEATKILRDGQILIIKGEKMYNVMGQTIK